MTEANPFGEGGFDMNALLQQAQQMQQQMMDAQAQLADATVTGTVGDGLVSVTLNGTGELVGVSIKKGSFDPEDTEDLDQSRLVPVQSMFINPFFNILTTNEIA